MYTLFEYAPSGNCYKCRLAMRQLNIPFERVAVNMLGGEQYGQKFKRMNGNSKVPVLQINEQQFLPESNAILFYLSEGTKLMPASPWARAHVMQWMFFEQYSHEPYIATVRFWQAYSGTPEKFTADIARCMPKGYKALDVMNEHLARHVFFADNQYSIADIALYAYTHCAGDGGFDLSRFPHILRWLERVQSTAQFIPLSA